MSTSPITKAEAEAFQARAESWGRGNPFRARQLARLGGLHRPSTAADDRHVMNGDGLVTHARDVAEAIAEGGCPF